MTMPGENDLNNDAPLEEALVKPVRRVFLLSLLPMLGLLLFAVAAGLGMRAFSHNNSFSCDVSCSRYSYALPIIVGILGVVVMMGGGMFASYYTARKVGLPLLAALAQRRQQQR